MGQLACNMQARPIPLMHDSMRTALSARRAQSLHACAAIWYNEHRRPSPSQQMAFAGVAQSVEYLPSKQAVAGSSPVSRSQVHHFPPRAYQIERKTPNFSPGDVSESLFCGRLSTYRRACGNSRLWSGGDNQTTNARVRLVRLAGSAVSSPGILWRQPWGGSMPVPTSCKRAATGFFCRERNW